jgi:hypothetical protein
MPTILKTEAKGKMRRRHQKAIREFKAWRKRNPNARTQETFDAFDLFVDSAESAELVEMVNAGEDDGA